MSPRSTFALTLHVLALFFSLLPCAIAQPPPRAWSSTPFDPPAIPLMVRSPFSMSWLPNGNGTALYNDWPTHSNGKRTGMSSSVRVDGAPYRILGQDNSDIQSGTQTSMQFTATSTIFTFRCGAVDFTYTFISPVDPTDLVRFSFPWSYLTISASSNDGTAHKVEVYADVSGEFINDKEETAIQWKTRNVDPEAENGLITHQFWQTTGTNCTQSDNNRIQDGTMYFSTHNHAGLTYTTFDSTHSRGQFWETGKLNNLLDKTFRNVGDRWPVFSFAHDLGSVLGASRTVVFGAGQARENLVQYVTGPSGLSQYRAPFYLTKFGSSEVAMDFFMRDHVRAIGVASAMDAQVEADGKGVSDNYAGLLQLAFRQAAAGVELTAGRTSSGTVDATDVMLFVAELGPGDHLRVNVMDQIYLMMPFFLYLNPDLIKYALRPTLQYHKAGLTKTQYCAHHIGLRYPQAMGTDSQSEMPVGASAAMVLLAASHLQRTGDKSLVDEYYDIINQFANYLVDTSLRPASQPTISETWMVPAAPNSANLAVQGIIALRAMADISGARGDTASQNKYISKSQELISQWLILALSSTGDHLVFKYDDAESYMIMHNLYADVLLGFNLIPKDIYTIQERWYQAKRSKYGPAVFKDRGWTLTGPSMWAAAMMEKAEMRNHFIDGIAQQLQSGMMSLPMPDHFDANYLSAYDDSKARPQVGTHFSILALQKKQINVPEASTDKAPPESKPEDAARSLSTIPSLFLASSLLFWIFVF